MEAYNRWRRQEYEGDAYTGPRAESRHWVEGWTSPDGVRWTSVGRVGDMSSDGGSAAQYDEETGGYYAYIRVGGMGRRATGLTRTDDFWQWPPASLVLAPDPQDDPDLSFYGCSYFRYPGNPDLHCAFVETYHQVGDYNDAQIAFSRDMTHWFRPDRRSIIPCGEPGSPDSGGARPWGGLIELPDGYWATMYRGHVGLHNYRKRRSPRSRTARACCSSPAGCRTASAAWRRRWRGGSPSPRSSAAVTRCGSTTAAGRAATSRLS